KIDLLHLATQRALQLPHLGLQFPDALVAQILRPARFPAIRLAGWLPLPDLQQRTVNTKYSSQGFHILPGFHSPDHLLLHSDGIPSIVPNLFCHRHSPFNEKCCISGCLILGAQSICGVTGNTAAVLPTRSHNSTAAQEISGSNRRLVFVFREIEADASV